MKQWIFVCFLLASPLTMGQNTSIETEEITVATENGQIFVRKEVAKNGRKSSEHSMAIYGSLTISLNAAMDVMKIGETLEKGQLEFVFNKECQLVDVRVIQTSQSKLVNDELKSFAGAVLEKIKQEDLNHLFLFDNELGFVNQDSCTDNLTILILMKVK